MVDYQSNDFEDGLLEDSEKRFFELWELYQDHDLDRIPEIKDLMVELSLTPENDLLFETIVDHIKPFVMKDRISPSVFKIPPGD
ncbi:hypothetical protein BVY01_00720 [bacterium I07]|nr:hypothetical protein BVY01_00720 [bacterium I07]